MFEAEVDVRNNRLYLTLNGRIEREDLETAADKAVDAADRLREGFDIINDLSGFAPPSPEAAKPIKRAQGELVERGVDRVVRVVDEETSQVVVRAFDRRSRDVGYSGETAPSVAEAERLLEEESVAGHASV
jgi:hypothetical protein